MKKKISGIYKIENLINHKVYIGQCELRSTLKGEGFGVRYLTPYCFIE